MYFFHASVFLATISLASVVYLPKVETFLVMDKVIKLISGIGKTVINLGMKRTIALNYPRGETLSHPGTS